jgi:hypothetical protein
VGSRCTFYLNGKKVGKATDSKPKAPEESYVALLARTFSSSEYPTTAFTDLTVLPAPEQ